MVKISDAAIIKLKEVLSTSKNPEKTMLRIAVAGFG